MGKDEYTKFLEDLSVQIGLVARYGGVLVIYPHGGEVKVLYAKDKKYFKKKLVKKVMKEAEWLDEEKLQREMLEDARTAEGDVES